jgi:hypothetical protein
MPRKQTDQDDHIQRRAAGIMNILGVKSLVTEV